LAAEAEVSKKHVDLLALKHVYRPADVCRHVNVVIVLEQTPQPVARMLFIVDDQDSGLDIHGDGESQMLDARFLLSIKFAPMTKHPPSPRLRRGERIHERNEITTICHLIIRHCFELRHLDFDI
jgi:hypothetical protein